MPRRDSSDFNPCGCLAVPGTWPGALKGLTKPWLSAPVDARSQRGMAAWSTSTGQRKESAHGRLVMGAAPGLGCRDAHLIKLPCSYFVPARVTVVFIPVTTSWALSCHNPTAFALNNLAPSVAPSQARSIPFPSRAVPAAECTHRCTSPSHSSPNSRPPDPQGPTKSWSCSNQSHFLSSRPRTASQNKRSLSL
jgi:hypothetical protein